MLSGIFLGGGADTAVSSATSPQGNWVGTYGASGYALADWNGSSDTTNLPGDALSLVEGSRYQWSSSTTDVRALESPDGSTREATCWYASSQLELQLSFGAAYSGNLELYALDWEPDSRSETISVNDGSLAIETAALTSFNDGAWMVFPITVASGGKVTITVQLTSGPNAVLSGIFLGGGADTAVSSATSPQGNWVGTYGASGYALADWNGSSDTTNLPGDALSLVEGSRYQWSSSTTDVRALESPDGSTREATCWYASSQLELQLSFGAAYSGNLELYALELGTRLPKRDDQRERRFPCHRDGRPYLLQRRGLDGVPHHRRLRRQGDHHRSADKWTQRCAVGDLPRLESSTPTVKGRPTHAGGENLSVYL